MIPISDGDLEDLILAKAPEYAEDLAKADAELTAGKTRPASDVFAELDL